MLNEWFDCNRKLRKLFDLVNAKCWCNFFPSSNRNWFVWQCRALSLANALSLSLFSLYTTIKSVSKTVHKTIKKRQIEALYVHTRATAIYRSTGKLSESTQSADTHIYDTACWSGRCLFFLICRFFFRTLDACSHCMCHTVNGHGGCIGTMGKIFRSFHLTSV